MPCNLAVTITHAAVDNEQLIALLEPGVVRDAIAALLEARYGEGEVTATVQPGYTHTAKVDGVVFIRLDRVFPGMYLAILNGQVQMSVARASATANDAAQMEAVEALQTEIEALLSSLADELFAAQVAEALGALGKVKDRKVQVNDQGTTKRAHILTVQL